MEKLILQCKVNEDEQIEGKLPTLLDEFISLNEEKSVSKTLEEVLSFTAHALESASSCTLDIESEIYRFKCNHCYQSKYQKYLKQHIQGKHISTRHYCN